MKLILEKYLYLLTEDPQMDAYEQNYKKLRDEVLKFHKKHNPQALAQKYEKVLEKDRPAEVRKILDDYQKLSTKFSESGKIKQAYVQYMRGEGPKPGSAPKPGANQARNTGKTYANQARNTGKTYANQADDILRGQPTKTTKNIMTKPIKGSTIFAAASIAAVIFAVMTIANRVKARRARAAMRTCSNFTGTQKQKCILSNQILAEKEKIKILYNSLSKSNQTKNPEQYVKEIQQEINKTKNRIIRLQKKL